VCVCVCVCVCIFFSQVANIFMAPSGKVQVSVPYCTMGLFMVLWIVISTFLHMYICTAYCQRGLVLTYQATLEVSSWDDTMVCTSECRYSYKLYSW